MKMLIDKYLLEPIPIWNPELAKSLSEAMAKELTVSGVIEETHGYSTASLVLHTPTHTETNYTQIEGINLEIPEYTLLQSFYSEHGLEPMLIEDFETCKVESQLNKAITLLAIVSDCSKSVIHLVKAIQILQQIEPEFDVSYSHPEIPFTIFVSIGIEETELNTIRLAESILHETMHLKLTLIERKVPLVHDNNQRYFSPWRDTYRSLRGVLHGLYVFKSIQEWYKILMGYLTDTDSKDFVSWRIETVDREIAMLSSFHLSPGLTKTGAHFAKALID